MPLLAQSEPDGAVSQGARAGWRPKPAHALMVAAAVAPPLATVAPLGLAPLLAVVAALAVASGAYRYWDFLGTVRPLVVLLGLLGVWATASALWSIVPMHS